MALCRWNRRDRKAVGAIVISDNGKGKGDALRVAFEHVDDEVVFVDVDDTYPVERIPEFIGSALQTVTCLNPKFKEYNPNNESQKKS